MTVHLGCVQFLHCRFCFFKKLFGGQIIMIRVVRGDSRLCVPCVSRHDSVFRPSQVWSALFMSLVCLLLAISGFSQGIDTGSIAGTVTDSTGASLPGAHVVALNNATNQTFAGETNDAGLILFRTVPHGIYKITITSKNFRTTVLDNIEVSVSKESNFGTVKLELGQVSETVEVEGAPPLLETTTPQVTTSFSTQTVADLPLSGSFDALALYIPGVADSGDNSFSNSNGASFTSNGLRGRSNN